MPRPRDIAIILGVAAIAGGVWLWAEVLEDRVVPRNFGVVHEGTLYRAGRQTPPTLTRIIKDNGIKTVLDLGGYSDGSERESEMTTTAEELGARRIEIRLRGDGTGNPNAFADAVRIMADPANQPVLVHCAAGSERTGAAVALYRHIYDGVPLIDALPEALDRKHDIEDNPRMFRYVVEHAPEIRARLESGAWIEGYPSPEDADNWSLIRDRTDAGAESKDEQTPDRNDEK